MTEPPASPPATSNVVDDALARVGSLDPVLAAILRREVDALRDGRKFGLVFNRHMPESVRLPNHPIKRGVKVALRNPHALANGKTDRSLKDATWRVTKVEKADKDERVAWLDCADTPYLLTDLVVIREFGEPVYPGLQSVGRIDRAADTNPTHIVINGENHHALQALQFTHRAKVDLIYIDPPYNTGNQGWIYNDKYVDVTKGDASSKWLSFMERRLVIAKELLDETGVIIVAIGDDEHHRLRMLMDQVFGAQNFISNVVWQGGGSSLSRFHAGGIDYMLVYARDMAALTAADVRWKVEKEGLQDVLDAASEAWEKAEHDAGAASRFLSTWWNRNKSKYDPGLGDNVKVDENGEAVKVGDLGNSLYRPNLKYPITDPVTGQTFDPPDNGWRFKKDVMQALIEDGGVLFGARPRLKTPLREMSMRSVMPSFYKDRRASSQHISKVFGDKRFPFPKDHDVLGRWINIVTSRNREAVILDFFGGSGSTTEAVLRLNAQDGGTRQSILVTNNELSVEDAKRLTKDGFVPGDPEWETRGVFNHVTRPRIETVVTGTREDGSTYSEGLDANVEFFDLTYLDESRVSRAGEFEAIAPLLWMQTGATGSRIGCESSDGFVISARYAVLHDEDATARFLKTLTGQADSEGALSISTVYVVTDSASHFEHVSQQLPTGVKAHRLYESYLRNFEINVEAP